MQQCNPSPPEQSDRESSSTGAYVKVDQKFVSKRKQLQEQIAQHPCFHTWFQWQQQATSRQSKWRWQEPRTRPWQGQGEPWKCSQTPMPRQHQSYEHESEVVKTCFLHFEQIMTTHGSQTYLRPVKQSSRTQLMLPTTLGRRWRVPTSAARPISTSLTEK